MDLHDLTDVTDEEMEGHIRSGTANAKLLEAETDWKAAIRETFEDFDVVYGVWTNMDPRAESRCGHCLAVIKGGPWLDEQWQAGQGEEIEARTFTLKFPSIRAAKDMCRQFGDDKENRAA